jgi:hypothetical protein
MSKPAGNYNNSQTCSQEKQDGCLFEDDVFHGRVVQVLANHTAANTTDPLFLYWASHACHGPREVYGSFFPTDLHSRMPLVPKPARLKLVIACDQWHASRVSTFFTSSHCKLRPNTEGQQPLTISLPLFRTKSVGCIMR